MVELLLFLYIGCWENSCVINFIFLFVLMFVVCVLIFIIRGIFRLKRACFVSFVFYVIFGCCKRGFKVG